MNGLQLEQLKIHTNSWSWGIIFFCCKNIMLVEDDIDWVDVYREDVTARGNYPLRLR